MITTSHDGQWAIVQRGRTLALVLSETAPPSGEAAAVDEEPAPGAGPIELDSEDVDVTFVGPPTVLAVVSRQPEPKVVLYQLPELEPTARLDLEAPMRLAAVTGPRLVLLGLDGKQVVIVRAAGRGLSSHPLDVGSPVEFSVGLERNQVLFSLLRKLEVWDAVSARPLLRLQLQLPPPPRKVGAAQGHLWVTRPGSDEVFIYRLSDGRPFRHHVGAPVEDVICSPASPVIVLVTPRGLVRLHCFAHSLTVIDAPWTPRMPLALLAAGDDISLLGVPAGATEPWRVPVSGVGAPIAIVEPSPGPSERGVVTAAEPRGATDERSSPPVGDAPITSAPITGAAAASASTTSAPFAITAVAIAPIASPAASPAASAPAGAIRAAPASARAWREPIAAFGLELARGAAGEVPLVAADTELGQLADQLALPLTARRALIALYGLYLVGDPALSIARLGHALADWSEGLGQGDLGALAMLRRKRGTVALRTAVTDLLDGLSPQAIRFVGGAASAPRSGAARLVRGGRADAAIETALATRLGRLGVIAGSASRGLLEARLHGATAVVLAAAPATRPLAWPRDASLVVVDDAPAPAWVAALPELT